MKKAALKFSAAVSFQSIFRNATTLLPALPLSVFFPLGKADRSIIPTRRDREVRIVDTELNTHTPITDQP